MDIEALRAIQIARGLQDVHLVELRADGFTLAHTDEERAAAVKGGAQLDECPLHNALLCGSPVIHGVYTAEKRDTDGYSESYRGDAIGWDFTPLHT